MKVKVDPEQDILREYHSLYEVHEFAVPASRNEDLHRENRRSHEYEGERWWGVPSYKDIAGLLTNGWPDGVQRALRALGQGDFEFKLPRRRRRREQGDQGEEVDIQQLYRGNYDQMWETTKTEEVRDTRAPVTLVVNITAHCGVRPEQFFWRGAASIALSDGFQRQGRMVRVIAYIAVAGAYETTDQRLFSSAIVKDFGEPMDLGRLATMLALPGFFRHVGFSMIEREDHEVSHHYGTPIHGTVEGLPLVEGDPVWIDSIWNQSSALSFLQEMKERFDAEE